MNKRGQVSIFVILAIVGVAMISTVVFVSMSKDPKIKGEKEEENPKDFLENCIEDDLRSVVKQISLQGGYMRNNLSINYRFENESAYNIAFLCYNINHYLPCKIQEPLLINHLEEEIHENIENNVQGCFDNYSSLLDDEGYVVDAKYRGFDVILKSGRLIIDINGNLKLTKSGETTNQENLKIVYRSSLYDLAEVAHEIISQEAVYCNFDKLGYMMIDRNIDIKRKKLETATIYQLKDIQSGDKFRFVVRSCKIPTSI